MEYQQIAEIEVRYAPIRAIKTKITTSKGAYDLALDCWNIDSINLLEEFKLVLLNRGNKVLGIHTLSRGGISATVVDLRLIFAIALKTASSSIILLHNHPSGLLKPSSHDTSITSKIKKAGELLNIQVLDHLIISEEGYFSFLDEGML